jgi:nucleoid-associated protein YgaU
MAHASDFRDLGNFRSATSEGALSAEQHRADHSLFDRIFNRDTMRNEQVQGIAEGVAQQYFQFNPNNDSRRRDAANLELQREGLLPGMRIDTNGAVVMTPESFERGAVDKAQAANMLRQFTGANSWKLDALSKTGDEPGNISREDIDAALQSGTIYDTKNGRERVLTPDERQGLAYIRDNMHGISDEYSWQNGWGITSGHMGASGGELTRFAEQKGVTAENIQTEDRAYTDAEMALLKSPKHATPEADGKSDGGPGKGGGPQQDIELGQRTFHLSPDGELTYDVQKGDNLWRIATDVLQDKTGEKPSAIDVLNYVKEIGKYNNFDTRDMNRIVPGDTLKIPPVSTDKEPATNPKPVVVEA